MRCSDINCSTRMVLTATRRSGDTKDFLPVLACRINFHQGQSLGIGVNWEFPSLQKPR